MGRPSGRPKLLGCPIRWTILSPRPNMRPRKATASTADRAGEKGNDSGSAARRRTHVGGQAVADERKRIKDDPGIRQHRWTENRAIPRDVAGRAGPGTPGGRGRATVLWGGGKHGFAFLNRSRSTEVYPKKDAPVRETGSTPRWTRHTARTGAFSLAKWAAIPRGEGAFW